MVDKNENTEPLMTPEVGVTQAGCFVTFWLGVFCGAVMVILLGNTIFARPTSAEQRVIEMQNCMIQAEFSRAECLALVLGE